MKNEFNKVYKSQTTTLMIINVLGIIIAVISIIIPKTLDPSISSMLWTSLVGLLIIKVIKAGVE